MGMSLGDGKSSWENDRRKSSYGGNLAAIAGYLVFHGKRGHLWVRFFMREM